MNEGNKTLQGTNRNREVRNSLPLEWEDVKWFNTGKENLEEGKNYEVRGTVKKHEDYKDTKTTVLTRVKAVQK